MMRPKGDEVMFVQKKIASLPEGTRILRSDLKEWILADHPDYRDSSIGWVIYDLVRSGMIGKAGPSLFLKGRKEYVPPAPSPDQKKILHFLDGNFPSLRIIVYDSSLLNEWAVHLLSQNQILVETEKWAGETVFEAIRNDLSSPCLFHPDPEEFRRYAVPNGILIRDLVSQAPSRPRSRALRLEKLMVDLFADPLLKSWIPESDLPAVFESMAGRYAIDFKTVMAYAKRRKIHARFADFLKKETDIPILGEEEC